MYVGTLTNLEIAVKNKMWELPHVYILRLDFENVGIHAIFNHEK